MATSSRQEINKNPSNAEAARKLQPIACLAPAAADGRAGGLAGTVQRLALACLASLGLAGLAACSGGDPPPDCSFFSNTCNPDLTQGPPFNFDAVNVYPYRLVVQAGEAAVFNANTTVQKPGFQWQRSADAGRSFVDIPGATQGSLKLGKVALADDSTVFRVAVSGGGSGAVVTATGRLLVSSQPGVVFRDAEFRNGDWAAEATASPLPDGPVHSEAQAPAGGHPGAYRAMVHTLPPGPSSLQVFHVALSATYDPAALGAIHAVAYAEDCVRQAASTPSLWVTSALLVDQGGRRYLSVPSPCTSAMWAAMPASVSLDAADFVLAAGPACGAAETCPDFSAGAPPLHFGFARLATLEGAAPAGTVEHGIDNWKVTVWRR